MRTGDPVAARQWLALQLSDGAGAEVLRRQAERAADGEVLARLDDQALLNRLQAQLESGLLRVCGRSR
ncbi:MAG: hypothetical protein Q8L92_10930, partial [Rubrivivax sp.]|nr:hypothetical protein [Rubrivivax sp.]